MNLIKLDWIKKAIMSPLATQVVKKDICPHCHKKNLQDRSTRELVVSQCSGCHRVYILKERTETGRRTEEHADMNERKLVVNFVDETYDLSDTAFKRLLRLIVEVRLTVKFDRANKGSYKDWAQAHRDYDEA